MTTICLVEDNPADVQLFKLALQDAGVECDLTLFEDGGEVIEYVRKHNAAIARPVPDLIILDLNLPKNDGLEIMRILRENPAFAKVPVAVLSSSTSARERAALAGFQISEFIAKPPDLEEYLKIGKIVGGLLHSLESQHGTEAAAVR